MELKEEIKVLARKNKIRSMLSLLGLIIVFFSSLSLFFYAELLIPPNASENYITTLSKNIEKDRVEMKTNRDAYEKAELALNEHMRRTKEGLSDLKSSYKTGKETFAVIRKKLNVKAEDMDISEMSRDDYLLSKATIEKEADLITNKLKSQVTTLSEILTKKKDYVDSQEKRLNERIEKEATKPTTIDDIISTAITRVGAVMLSVFMMQILLSFYRYFARLSNFYESKVVVSSVFKDDTSIEEIQKTLSTEHITFGKDPAMPIEKIIDLIKLSK